MKKLLTLSVLALFAASAMAEEPKTGTQPPVVAPAGKAAPKAKSKRVKGAKGKKSAKDMPANPTK